MKKLGGVFVAACLAATLVQGPAGASTGDAVSRRQAAKLCKAFFAQDRCENLAGQWRLTLAAGDEAAAERFVDAVAADARKDAGPGSEECRLVFSETVCVWVDWGVGIVLWPIMDPEGFVNAWRQFSLQYVDEAYRLVDGAYASVKAAVRCALDPACTPI